MRREAFIGLAGDFCDYVCGPDGAKSEVSPPGMLVQFLVWFGCAIGEKDWLRVSANRHFMNENVLIIGSTAWARKGMTAEVVEVAFKESEPTFDAVRAFEHRVHRAIGSGQGITLPIRDEQREMVPVVDKKTGNTRMEEKVTPGSSDKRLLVNIGEFSGVLAASARSDSTVTSVLREAWDHKPLGSLIRNEGKGGDRCMRPHVSVAAHVTRPELLAKLKTTEESNGFINRFILVYQTVPKVLHADGGTRCDGAEWQALTDRLKRARNFFRLRDQPMEARLSPEAQQDWDQRVYPKWRNLAVDERVAAIVARSDAHCLRLALIYAALDTAEARTQVQPIEVEMRDAASSAAGIPPPTQPIQIELRHLHAAEAVIDYAVATAAHLFDDKFAAQRRQLKSVIDAHGGAVAWDVARKELGLRSKAEIEAVVQQLERVGCVKVEVLPAPARGGRKKKLIRWSEE